MTSTGDWDNEGNCDEIREEYGLDEGDYSTCWEDHYNNLPEKYYFNYHEIVDIWACDQMQGNDCKRVSGVSNGVES